MSVGSLHSSTTPTCGAGCLTCEPSSVGRAHPVEKHATVMMQTTTALGEERFISPPSARGGLALGGLLRFLGKRQGTGVDWLAVARQDLELHGVFPELGEYEGEVGVEAGSGQRSLPDVPLTQLGRTTFDEVVDPVLRLDALVEVFVSGEHDVHAVLDEQRLDLRAQVHFGSVLFAGRVQRMVEVGDLPAIVGFRQ